jgi:LacI family transcriptional regulator
MTTSKSSPTLSDVAREAGVHVGTASRALDPNKSHLVNQTTREHIQATADRLGYRMNGVARSLRKGASGLLAVVVADVSNPFLPPVLRGIEAEIREDEMLLLIAETHDEPDVLARILENLLTRRVDAIIISATRRADDAVVRRFAKIVPVVLAVRRLADDRDEEQVPTVTHDDDLGARLAVGHLADRGHRRVAELPGPADVSSFAGRSRGFRSIVAERGLIDLSGELRASQPTIAEGRRLAHAVLDRPAEERPTALFAHNDQMAVGALEALAAHGMSCPADISVVGYNDAPLTSHLDPPLTTVRLPSEELGHQAARLALAALADRSAPAQTLQLPPKLVVRSSTGPPPGAAAQARRRKGPVTPGAPSAARRR